MCRELGECVLQNAQFAAGGIRIWCALFHGG
jgi:hypothetical protein